MNILTIDVGGANIKLLASNEHAPRKIASGPKLTAAQMVADVQAATSDWTYDVISIGYPGPVLHDRPIAEPKNLGEGWVGFDFAKAFGKPVKIVNDAIMQALGSYEGGRMLFLGLGTGLGSGMIVDGILEPMELAHLPYRKGTFEDYVGERGLKLRGGKKWRKSVADVVDRLQAALEPDYVVLGGGNVRKLKEMPDGAKAGSNARAFDGGFRLWVPDMPLRELPKEVAAPAGETCQEESCDTHQESDGEPQVLSGCCGGSIECSSHEGASHDEPSEQPHIERAHNEPGLEGS